MNFCSVEGCWKTSYAKGYCRPHWWRLKTYGRLHKIVGVIKGNCTIDGCGKKIKGHGLCVNHYTMLKTYGLHPTEYYKMLESQGNVCAICKEPETSLFHNKPGKVKKLSVDHCHATGKVREILCQRCNHFLGRVEEKTELLQAMIDYLNKHKEVSNV